MRKIINPRGRIVLAGSVVVFLLVLAPLAVEALGNEPVFSGNGQAGVTEERRVCWGEPEDAFRVEQHGWYIDRITVEHEDSHENASPMDSMNYIGLYGEQGNFAWYHLFHLEGHQLQAVETPFELDIAGNKTGVRLQFRPWEEVGQDEVDMAVEDGYGFYISEVKLSNGEEEVVVEPEEYDLAPPQPEEDEQEALPGENDEDNGGNDNNFF